ncbi:MAG: hypothetical protein ACEY3J_00990 [Arsenophonus sp.]
MRRRHADASVLSEVTEDGRKCCFLQLTIQTDIDDVEIKVPNGLVD